jgi:hypothetical protein
LSKWTKKAPLFPFTTITVVVLKFSSQYFLNHSAIEVRKHFELFTLDRGSEFINPRIYLVTPIIPSISTEGPVILGSFKYLKEVICFVI